MTKRQMIAFLLAWGTTGLGVGLFGCNQAEAGPPATVAPERPGPGTDNGADIGAPIRSLAGHRERVTSVAYSPDGRWIATAAWDGTARLWDAQTDKEVLRLDVPATRDYHIAHLSQVVFSRDNEFIVVAQQAAPNESGVIVWRRRTGEKVHELLGGAGSVALSPDGRLIACGGFGIIRLYDFATGKVVREMHSQQTRIESLLFSPEGKTLLSVGPPRRPPSGDGMQRLGGMPDLVRVWDVATGKEPRSCLNGLFAKHPALSSDGRTVATASFLHETSSLHETATGGQRAKLIGHTNGVCAVSFSRDGRTLASGSMDGTVRLWDLPSGKEVGRLGKEVPQFAGRGWVLAVAFSPDGRTLAAGGLDKTLLLWDVSRVTTRRREPAESASADLEADWRDLAGDPETGYAALGRLVSSPARAVAFLEKQLQSTQPVNTKRIEQLITNLEDERFAVREQATRELAALGERAELALRKALVGSSPETRRRLDALLDRLEAGNLATETVRQLRALEALETIGNPEARQLLDKIAKGPSEVRLTNEATAAADRLAKRAAFGGGGPR